MLAGEASEVLTPVSKYLELSLLAALQTMTAWMEVA